MLDRMFFQVNAFFENKFDQEKSLESNALKHFTGFVFGASTLCIKDPLCILGRSAQAFEHAIKTFINSLKILPGLSLGSKNIKKNKENANLELKKTIASVVCKRSRG